MFQVDDEPTETLHIYVVRKAAPRPSMLPVFLSVFALALLVAFCVLVPYQQTVARITLRVPAILASLKTFTVQVAIIPTGVKVYPARNAHGVLRITNGSVISQNLPAGLTFISNRGVSLVTETAVFVPAGSANGYGFATVAAHALMSGKAGNIPAYAINTVEGSSVYIRNLTAFRGGSDAYSVKFATPQDRQTALAQARQHLAVVSTGLHYPCSETVSGALSVTWRCQFITYHIPAFYHVTAVKISGRSLVVAVWFVARPYHIWVK
jgi:hypothetical protein